LHRLKDKASRLAARMENPGACLEDETRVLEDCQKCGRNCAEDLHEEMVALDNLSGLRPEDRKARKSAIAHLDASLEEVDNIRAELVALEKTLRARIEARGNAKLKPSDADSEIRENMTLYLRGNPAAKPEEFYDVPPPSADFWESLKCPLELSCSEDTKCFYATSRPLGILPKDVKLALSPDATLLTVSGVSRPTKAEVGEMQTKIQTHLAQVGSGPVDVKKLRQLYAKIARGTYGMFVETIRLPKSVDETMISASCDGGVLRVKLPKRARRSKPHPHATMFGGYPFLR